MNKYDLQERLINFSVLIIEIANSLPGCIKRRYFSGQIVRSGSSVSLNYGEALGAESRKDFIHKMKIILKELRETYISLQIIRRIRLIKNENKLKAALDENNELISIFVTSVVIAEKNLHGE